METASIELWHGSSHVIKHPEYGLVKPNNDYGRGFWPFAVWCGWVCQVVTVLRSSLPQVR